MTMFDGDAPHGSEPWKPAPPPAENESAGAWQPTPTPAADDTADASRPVAAPAGDEPAPASAAYEAFGSAPPNHPEPSPAPSPGAPTGASGARGTRGKRRVVGAVAALAVVAAAAGGAGAAIGVQVGESHHSSTVTIGATSPSSVATRPAAAASGSVSAAADKVLPSVVTINEQGQSGGGTGSGVIISADGYILTNNHVVSDAANGGTLEVILNSGKKVSATIVGRDPISDLAVIKASGAGQLTPATLGDSDSLQIGQQLVAVGSPLGLSGTVTSGIVSSLHRAVATGDPSVSDTNAVIDAIQTDAAINPGNSGGPLVDMNGAVVGINSAIATVGGGSGGFGGQQTQESGNIGVGFAIPIDSARNVATQLIQSGHATHAYLGVQATTDNADRTGAGDSNDDGDGARVGTVQSGGPADKAGLKADDVITAVGSRTVTGVESLITAVQSHNVGDKVSVTYQRGGSQSTVTVTLGALPSSSS
ncbi:MAG TPA: trypsin-like peptidase domain-containing protein [Acidimicrobiia bacterium]|jgi:putative serine protease PepD